MDYEQLRILIPKPTQEWSQQDVKNWLKFINLQSCIGQFSKKQIDGSCLRLLSQADLIQEMGIESRIMRKKLINWIRNGLPQFDRYLLEYLIMHDGAQDNMNNGQRIPLQPVQKTQVNSYQQTQTNELDMKRSVKKKQEWEVLVLRKIEGRQNIYYKFKQRDCRIGINSNCQVILKGDGIDEFHSIITFRKNQFYMRNLSDQYATYIKVNARMPIHDAMRVEMGSNIFQFNLDAKRKLQIQVVYGKKLDYTYKFAQNQHKIMVGRKSSNDVYFTQDNTLSNIHARITFADHCWFIEDMATTNGTWIELQQDEQITIHSNLVFKLGATNIQFECQIRKVKQKSEQEENIIDTQSVSQYCYMCGRNTKNILFSPCNHCIVCQECVQVVKTCLICKQRISGFTKIFKS